MTTAVTVDAHAGWPVDVAQIMTDVDGNEVARNIITVPANTVMTFYCHSSMKLEIEEGKREPGT